MKLLERMVPLHTDKIATAMFLCEKSLSLYLSALLNSTSLNIALLIKGICLFTFQSVIVGSHMYIAISDLFMIFAAVILFRLVVYRLPFINLIHHTDMITYHFRKLLVLCCKNV